MEVPCRVCPVAPLYLPAGAGCLVCSSKELPFAVVLLLRSISFIWTDLSHLVRRLLTFLPLSSQTEKTFTISVPGVEKF